MMVSWRELVGRTMSTQTGLEADVKKEKNMEVETDRKNLVYRLVLGIDNVHSSNSNIY